MYRFIRRDTVGTWQAEANNLSKVTNTFTAILQEHSSFLPKMNALLNYDAAVQLHGCVKSMDARITDIFKDMISQAYLSTRTLSTYDTT